MDAASRSLVVFGIYLMALAVGLIAVPAVVLGLFGLPAPTEPWIRVLGLVTGILGYYYLVAARGRLYAFYPATVYGRAAAAASFLLLVVTGLGPWQLVLFGAVDLLAALWTHQALTQKPA